MLNQENKSAPDYFLMGMCKEQRHSAMHWLPFDDMYLLCILPLLIIYVIMYIICVCLMIYLWLLYPLLYVTYKYPVNMKYT